MPKTAAVASLRRCVRNVRRYASGEAMHRSIADAATVAGEASSITARLPLLESGQFNAGCGGAKHCRERYHRASPPGTANSAALGPSP
jgi:hypothetical protein